MKKIFNGLLWLLLIFSLSGCAEPAANGSTSTDDAAQKIEIMIDGVKKTADTSPLISAAFTSEHLVLSYLSEKDDVQFSVSAFMQDLKPGSFQVYECKSASQCDAGVPDNNQLAVYGPFPKEPMPPLNLFRTAYYAPRLGLQPLMFVIASVRDEQEPGNPFKTKRIEGYFKGSLAYAEQQRGGYEWRVVGAPVQVDGNFNLLCSMR